MATNIQDYEKTYDTYKDTIDLACTCIDCNSCVKVSETLDETIQFLNNQINNLSDWEDSAKGTFSGNLKICISNLENIKMNIEDNWVQSETLYKNTLTQLSKLKTNVSLLKEEIKNEPRMSSYKVKIFDATGNIISISYPGYPTALSNWENNCNTYNSLCSEFCTTILQNINDLEEINNNLITAQMVPTINNLFHSNNIDLTVYKTNPVSGFNNQNISFGLSMGNQTYNLSDKDLNLLYAIVASEAAHNPDDALGVASVILNRVESNDNYGGGRNPTPITIVTAKNQFEGYFGGYYKRYLNNNGEYIGDSVIKQAVDDALNGVRNTNATYFLANSCKHYSNNLITPDGNRYNMTWKA